MTNPRELIETYGAWVDHGMQKWFLDHPRAVPAYPMAEYHLGWRDQALVPSKAAQGKMLRPVLSLLSYKIFREDLERIIPLAAAIEFYHNHTLVFDDMQDGDRFRRNRPTVWSLWGIGQGINVGLILGYLSEEFFLDLLNHDFPQEKLVSLTRAMIDTKLEVAEGQSLDLDFETKSSVNPSEYLNMIGKKTGALISLCTYGGSLLAQDNPVVAEKFKDFGRRLGIAMQIRDDLVGIWGGKEQSGKERAKDLRRRKKTFPIFNALQHLKGKDLERLQDYLRSSEEPKEETIAQIITSLEQSGIRAECEKSANQLMDEVFATLHQIGISQAKLGPLETFSRHAFDSIGTLRQVASPA